MLSFPKKTDKLIAVVITSYIKFYRVPQLKQNNCGFRWFSTSRKWLWVINVEAHVIDCRMENTIATINGTFAPLILTGSKGGIVCTGFAIPPHHTSGMLRSSKNTVMPHPDGGPKFLPPLLSSSPSMVACTSMGRKKLVSFFATPEGRHAVVRH